MIKTSSSKVMWVGKVTEFQTGRGVMAPALEEETFRIRPASYAQGP
jgi:hypothetical protein